MSQISDRDVQAIQEWLAKEPHLPNTFDDYIIKKFLFSCDCSLERTKKCIDEFCTRRAHNLNDMFSNRDPTSKKVQDVFSWTEVTTYMDGNNELLIHKITEVPKDVDFHELIRAFTVELDNWMIIKRDIQPDNHIVIIDIGAYTLKLIAKVNILLLKNFVSYLVESMPLRLKEVHFVNCPSFYEYMYNIVKPAFPDFLCKMMHFHPNHTGLYKTVNKEALPKEYGGDSESMTDQHAFWIKYIADQRKFYLNDNLWKTDLNLRVKRDNLEDSMIGSFKTLEFD